MSTRASHRKQNPNSVISTMFATGIANALTREDGQPILESAKPQRTANGQPLIMIWDELIALHENCRQGLESYTSVAALKGRKDLFEAMSQEDRTTYIAKMTQLFNDLKAYDQDLATIRALHAGKTGGESDMALVMQSIQITEQYEHFRNQAEKVLGQSYLHIVELIQRAEINLAAQHDVDNPNIITDVVSVEVIDEEEVLASS
jgi:hypothetical protein